jgi:hypothetical protein
MSLKFYIDRNGNRIFVQSQVFFQTDALEAMAYQYPAAVGGFVPGFVARGTAVTPVGIGVRVA